MQEPKMRVSTNTEDPSSVRDRNKAVVNKKDKT